MSSPHRGVGRVVLQWIFVCLFTKKNKHVC
jgi:hypothetical protein